MPVYICATAQTFTGQTTGEPIESKNVKNQKRDRITFDAVDYDDIERICGDVWLDIKIDQSVQPLNAFILAFEQNARCVRSYRDAGARITIDIVLRDVVDSFGDLILDPEYAITAVSGDGTDELFGYLEYTVYYKIGVS